MMKEKLDIISYAIHNKAIVILIVSLLALFGVYSLVVMPKQELPVFVVRQGLVFAVYPGADSEEVESQVSKPLENFVFGFKEVKRNKTYSISRDGISIIHVELNDDIKNKDEFWSKFKHRLTQFKGELPKEVVHLEVNDDFGNTSSLLLSLESDKRTYRELEKYLENVKSRLRTVEAVGDLSEYGIQRERITVSLDREKLSAYGINETSIGLNLMSQGYTTISGAVEDGNTKVPIHVAASYDSERDVAEQIIYSDPKGNIIRLKDVARIKREYPSQEPYITNNGKKCVLLSVSIKNGYNIVQAGNSVKELIGSEIQKCPDDVKAHYISDQSQVVQDSVTNFLGELLIAIIAVILVLMVFLPFRIASIAALTIPITIFMSLGIFYICGIELNSITLAALILSLGILVDDSIVVIDGYIEKLDHGIPCLQASISSAREFFPSIMTATLAISITFFPFLWTTTGMYNDFLKDFPWAISIILGFSLLVAMLLVPFIQSRFIRKGLKKEEGKNKKGFLDKVQCRYDRLIDSCFSHSRLVLAIGVVVVVCGFAALYFMPLRLMPVAERNQFAVELYLPEGTSINQTALVADSLKRMLGQDERVVSITSFIGTTSPRFHATYAPQIPGDNFAQFIVNTKSDKATDEVLTENWEKYIGYFPSTTIRFKQMDYSDAVSPIEVRLMGEDMHGLKLAADTIVKLMREKDELLLVRSSHEQQLPGIRISLDKDESIRTGITQTVTSVTLGLSYGRGIPVATLWEGDYPVDLVLRADRNDGTSQISEVCDEYIPAFGGSVSVPLRQIADVKADWTYAQRIRRNGLKTITILAEVKRNVNAIGMTGQLKEDVAQKSLPDGVSVSMGGAEERDFESLPQILSAMLISVMIIFFILLFHFGKIRMTLLILSSMLMSIPGAVFGILIMDLEVGTTSIIGVITLMGILVRNGIILVDYAEELYNKQGMSVREAAVHSAKRRLRPIFLTSVTAALGVIPMIISKTALWTPLGSVVCFGTLFTMMMTLTIVPIAYWKVFNNRQKIVTDETL